MHYYTCKCFALFISILLSFLLLLSLSVCVGVCALCYTRLCWKWYFIISDDIMRPFFPLFAIIVGVLWNWKLCLAISRDHGLHAHASNYQKSISMKIICVFGLFDIVQWTIVVYMCHTWEKPKAFKHKFDEKHKWQKFVLFIASSLALHLSNSSSFSSSLQRNTYALLHPRTHTHT